MLDSLSFIPDIRKMGKSRCLGRLLLIKYKDICFFSEDDHLLLLSVKINLAYIIALQVQLGLSDIDALYLHFFLNIDAVITQK